jgi:Antitoxin Xre-like helix-turn-helix domain/Antitoxin Xre/MbcA/ParS C-terminal toxin-binding domain
VQIPLKPSTARRDTSSVPARRPSSKAPLQAFFRIAALWQLSPEQQMKLLGLQAPSTFYNWRKSAPSTLPRDTLERISYVLGIYKALQILIPDPRSADAWVKKPNGAPLFNGKSALGRMLTGNVSDLYVVRQYLDAQRGGWS